ncbi:MAG: isoprenylcysteine carboxylmethyltransferase family protein [Candidatus Sulfotelmatobacter sp.]
MEGRTLYVFSVMQVVAVCIALFFVLMIPGRWDLQRCLGIGLMLAGLAGIAVARYQLGRSFSVRPEAHKLVTHGIYSKIRNPIYVFGAVVFAGLVLVIHRPVLWVLIPVMIIVQTIRAHREAQVLEAAFGDTYREYRSKTWF